ncbi:acetyltransferase [Apilactobacillus ozensis DSM 23829 = JCM 17196]|uniref:Acetyltransferase n=1 Tax=Apilactobacillus ozensis DSM 23829 = JCM 17196 TaxID=1423781 RepID=A0A0R2AXA3_9LACO|nr:GNAT family N-acetyltransferase [Apilactobacillus ozensis]KRM67500.1 acetyltransferase [Apilactobacillus ozensis DSM 23829 = JCM 17196]
MWKIKNFNDLSIEEFYKIMHLRIETFIVEQKRIYQELDAHDLKAKHIFYEKDDEIIAYARIMEEDVHVTFGRVVASSKHRGEGLGKQLLDNIMKAIKQYFPNKLIEIEAQQQVEKFYAKAGFTSQGDSFIFASTPHVKMIHQPL